MLLREPNIVAFSSKKVLTPAEVELVDVLGRSERNLPIVQIQADFNWYLHYAVVRGFNRLQLLLVAEKSTKA